MFPPGIEPGAFRVLSGCDKHYTTETIFTKKILNFILQEMFSYLLINFALHFDLIFLKKLSQSL